LRALLANKPNDVAEKRAHITDWRAVNS